MKHDDFVKFIKESYEAEEVLSFLNEPDDNILAHHIWKLVNKYVEKDLADTKNVGCSLSDCPLDELFRSELSAEQLVTSAQTLLFLLSNPEMSHFWRIGYPFYSHLIEAAKFKRDTQVLSEEFVEVVFAEKRVCQCGHSEEDHYFEHADTTRSYSCNKCECKGVRRK